MTVIVPHHTTQSRAIEQVEKSANDLLDLGSKSIVLADQKRTWTGPRMDFSLTANAGFISLPLSGSVLVDDVNVTIEVELPALAKTFIGEDKIRGTVQQKIRGLLSA
jgi:hypothetical protein